MPLLCKFRLNRSGDMNSQGVAGTLPFDIGFSDSPPQALQRVGRPPDREVVGDDVGAYFWQSADHVLHVMYSLFDDQGVAEKKVRLKGGDFDVNVVAAAHGVEFEFADQTKYKFEGNMPDGALVLGVVFFSPASQDRVGPMPHGVRFDMTREQAAAALGRPVWTSPVAPIDRWHLDGRDMTVRFDRATTKVQKVIFSLTKQVHA